ncbi:MAG: valS, partial [Lacunisphaera sp.]|nr:valS [Lacunisphaera sp.]
QALYGFFWNDFCDWYVEVSKTKLQDPATKANCLAIQDLVLRQTLLLLHPFTPFITEELWHLLGYGAEGTFLMRDTQLDNPSQLAGHGLQLDHAAAALIGQLKAVVSQVRAFKAEQGEAANKASEFVVEANDAHWAVLETSLAKLKRMMGAASVVRGPMSPNAPAIVTAYGSWNLIKQLKGDPVAEQARLTKELEALAKHIAGTEARLANEAFVSKAPPAVLEGARKQLADQKAKQAELTRLLQSLG